mmetsp:Transcript_73884/g.208565  ORF Transcript_73884/g.208565 Transcript_73884/m.208565 type:complete len:209 (+) Transcript_73884:124-750(+)
MAPPVASICALLAGLLGPTVAIQSAAGTSNMLTGPDIVEFLKGMQDGVGDKSGDVETCQKFALDLTKVQAAVTKLGSTDTLLQGIADLATELQVLGPDFGSCTTNIQSVVSPVRAMFTMPQSVASGLEAVVQPVMHFSEIMGLATDAQAALSKASYQEAGKHVGKILSIVAPPATPPATSSPAAPPATSSPAAPPTATPSASPSTSAP